MKKCGNGGKTRFFFNYEFTRIKTNYFGKRGSAGTKKRKKENLAYGVEKNKKVVS